MLKITFKFLVPVLFISALILLGGQSGLADEVRSDALVRIDVQENSELERFAGWDIPVYAQLVDDVGGRYLLAVVNISQQLQLTEAGFALQILDPIPGENQYYIVYTPHPGDSSRLPENASEELW